MHSMILAAGRGTRLAPITNDIPKALVPVGGVPMLERVARRLIDAGSEELVVNVHHLGETIIDFLERRDNFGVKVSLSDERDLLLDTGGGLKKAAPLLGGRDPFFLHNVDILTDADLGAMYREGTQNGALATLAVKERETARYFLFDDIGLCGRGNDHEGLRQVVRETVGEVKRLGFCGIHVISPSIFDLITEENAFSITPLYVRLAAGGAVIRPWRIDDAEWIDIGTHERLAQAEEFVADEA